MSNDIMDTTDLEDDELHSLSDFENVLGDDYAAHTRDSLFTRLKQTITRFTTKGYYKKVPRAFATNGIELRDRAGSRGDADSFDLSDDEFIVKRQADGVFSRLLEKFTKYTLYSLVVILLIIVTVLGALLSKRSSQPSKPSHIKTLLNNGTHDFYPTTILISLDGFHPHYISKDLTPALHDLFVDGYGPPYMKPSFPSSTFPNHWTIATGLLPSHHGIVGNSFYDPTIDKQFINVIPEKSLDPVFWGGQPIWSTAESNGVKSAIHMFPGSEVKFQSWNPTEVDKFNKTESLEVKHQRIDGWLSRDIEKRPELILSYVPTIDSLGHKYGISGKEIEEGLQQVDTFIHELQTSIAEKNLTDIVNLVIVSDHGMSVTSSERLVYFDDLVNTTKIEHLDGWPLYGLRPLKEYSVDEVYNELKQNFVENSGYNIYLKDKLPSSFQFGGALNDQNSKYYDRIAPIWIIPEVGYAITTHADMERKKGVYTPKGVHGYDNSEVLMRAIFLGQGPFFKSKNEKPYKVEPFQNFEVYNILCETLNIKPNENDGASDIFKLENKLLEKWQDPLSYPNVDFDLDVLKKDSTYDLLFRNEVSQTTTLQPETSVENTEQTPQNDDDKEDEENKQEESKGTEESKPDEQKGDNKEEQESHESDKESSKEDTKEEDKQDNKGHEDKGKKDHKGESIWDKIGDAMEEIEDQIEDAMEDIEDQIDEWVDDIEDAFDDAMQFEFLK